MRNRWLASFDNLFDGSGLYAPGRRHSERSPDQRSDIRAGIFPHNRCAHAGYLLSKADIRSNLLERPGTSSRPVVASAVLRAMISDRRIAETEDGFRTFMRTVNKFGGGELFEVMPRTMVTNL
ncbi:DUF6339 family protein [Bradyrhizobium sp.]|jgi:hypothetical protein|uniref:DUF6339 family protein n=1 Tax=Bradyrhizobium sp. TaxID=376 RepID=UPI002DFAB628|nr:DUF6339 family protein [Bradyrhizobium sp.]